MSAMAAVVNEWARRRLASRGDRRDNQSGQSTVEYALLLALISVPLCILVLRLFELLISSVVTAIVADFTNGP